MDIRTVLMVKDGMIGVIGLATSSEHSQVARIDLRESQPVSSEFDSPEKAAAGFQNMLRTSRKNG
ncbi:MAG: hypothetical protein WKF84_30495 [Pyrinomonadaceae bacterium]